MKRSTFLLIYFLAISSFFYLKPLGYLRDIGRGFPILIFDLIWLLFGYLYYRRNRIRSLYTSKNLLILWWLFIGIIPSVFIANYDFNQSFFQSFVSYRDFFLFLAIPAFLHISPTDKDCLKAIFMFSVLFLIVGIIKTLGVTSIFMLSEKESNIQEMITNSDSNDFFAYPLESTYELIIIPLYYYCQKLYFRYNNKDCLRIIFLYSILLIVQNRSTLFPATIVVALTFLKTNMHPLLLKYLVITSGICFAAYLSSEILQGLLEQTDEELTSKYDPRAKAMNYFLDFSRRPWYELLFGTGNISFLTSNYVRRLQLAHIHYSDVGFVGFWHQFGIIPIITFSFFLIKALLLKKIPPYVKLVSLHIIICSVTISYFFSPVHMIRFIMFYYLYCYYTSPQISLNILYSR